MIIIKDFISPKAISQTLCLQTNKYQLGISFSLIGENKTVIKRFAQGYRTGQQIPWTSTWGNLFLINPCRILVPMRSAGICVHSKPTGKVLLWECMHFLPSGVAEKDSWNIPSAAYLVWPLKKHLVLPHLSPLINMFFDHYFLKFTYCIIGLTTKPDEWGFSTCTKITFQNVALYSPRNSFLNYPRDYLYKRNKQKTTRGQEKNLNS